MHTDELFKKTEEVRSSPISAVNSSEDVIIFEDLNRVILDWNSAAERMFQYTAEEVIGRSIDIIVPPDFRSVEHEIFGRLCDGECIGSYETRRVAKNGTASDVSISVSLVKDAEGGLIGAFNIMRMARKRKFLEVTRVGGVATKDTKGSFCAFVATPPQP